MKIDGKIIGRKPIWMDGELKGSIECESEVVIGPTAKIEATIKAATIKINGQVKGDLFASARMEVLSQGGSRETSPISRDPSSFTKAGSSKDNA